MFLTHVRCRVDRILSPKLSSLVLEVETKNDRSHYSLPPAPFRLRFAFHDAKLRLAADPPFASLCIIMQLRFNEPIEDGKGTGEPGASANG
ncbi:hypothetical protein BDV29DRAFT_181182 [Aspergillus leporis]|jgi:hypothetical protein|uniref:Uncharacterized protein n=1 Tax=Aspergillus leporis TaxID=41062 RepID=A0A5N5WP72_9EURO|nr:hypothetical protein BDV29DRAFT_181182 [Aspergillus leporis]